MYLHLQGCELGEEAMFFLLQGGCQKQKNFVLP